MEKAPQRYLRWHRSAGHTAKTLVHHSHSISLFIRWYQQRGYSTALIILTPIPYASGSKINAIVACRITRSQRVYARNERTRVG